MKTTKPNTTTMERNYSCILFPFGGFLAAALLAVTSLSVPAADAPAKPATLITNARVFDGQNEKLAAGMSVLVEGNKITKIAKTITAPQGATVIDAKGRTMTPGFIYMHEHIMMQASGPELLMADDRYMAILATRTTRQYLDRGITSVRDAAGNTFGLKEAIDKGIVPGPRIFPSGSGTMRHRFEKAYASRCFWSYADSSSEGRNADTKSPS